MRANRTIRFRSRLAFIVLSLIAIGSGAIASGSDSKKNDNRASEKKQVAVRQYNSGVKNMERAKTISVQGDSTFAYNYRATADAKTRKAYEKAVEDFTDAIGLDPEMIEAHNNLGYCYRKLGMLEESLAAYEAALAIDSTYAQAREYRGETFLALGDLKRAEAERDYLESLESPYADTLSMSIDMYKLRELGERMKEAQ